LQGLLGWQPRLWRRLIGFINHPAKRPAPPEVFILCMGDRSIYFMYDRMQVSKRIDATSML
jgi:hypothetical protein